MRFSNLHTHTTFSDGVGNIRENIESAILKNMVSLGFSDHSFTACDTSYCMKLENYDRYLFELEKAKKEYADKIRVFSGIEKDYYSDIDKNSFDYTIGSVHYIIKNDICYPVDHSEKQQRDCINDAFCGDVLEFAKCYYHMVCEQAINFKPNVIGHFDVINKFSIIPENDEKYIDIALGAVKEIVKHCNVFEINTGAISRGYRTMPYPNKEVLELLLKLGGEVTLGSDSHNPKNLDYFFNESVDLLKKIGFNHISVFNGTGFDKISI